jgi:hypothetical protein
MGEGRLCRGRGCGPEDKRSLTSDDDYEGEADGGTAR